MEERKFLQPLTENGKDGKCMKRVLAACIMQTLHFKLKDGENSEYAKRAVKEEVRKYKESLERGRVQHRILSEEEQPDGSVIIEIKKQYNTSSVGNYLDE